LSPIITAGTQKDQRNDASILLFDTILKCKIGSTSMAIADSEGALAHAEYVMQVCGCEYVLGECFDGRTVTTSIVHTADSDTESRDLLDADERE
jgi:hypothetical protein